MLSEVICERIVNALFHSFWLAGLTGITALISLRWFSSALARSLVCGVAMILMGLSIPIGYRIPDRLVAVEWTGPAGDDPLLYQASDAETASANDSTPALAGRSITESPRSSATAGGQSGNAFSLSRWIVCAYGLGVVIFSLRFLRGLGFVFRLKRSARESTDAELSSLCRQIGLRLGIKVAPRVSLSKAINVPAIAGMIRPMILFPASLVTRLSPAEIEAVLLHELVHLRRHDQFILAAQRLIETVLFFHPVVWVVSRRLSREREWACDDAVIHAGAQPVSYAESLLKVARFSLGQATPLLSMAGNGKGQLLQRIHRIVDEDVPQSPACKSTSRHNPSLVRSIGVDTSIGLGLLLALVLVLVSSSFSGQGNALAEDAGGAAAAPRFS